MKAFLFTGMLGLSLLASCRQNPENGGEERRGDEPRTDTPYSTEELDHSKLPADSVTAISNRNNPPAASGSNATGSQDSAAKR